MLLSHVRCLAIPRPGCDCLPARPSCEPTRRGSTLACAVCTDALKNVMFEPCRHVSVCESCAPKVDECPLCRKPATRKVPVYL